MKKAITRQVRGGGAANAKKMTKDLQNAMELVKTWSSDPAEVFQNYGLAKDKADVEVDLGRVGVGMPSFGDIGGVDQARVCGCGCAAVIEAELEVEW